MGFQLTIAEGKEAGREVVFEQSSVTIGRSGDCDVVLNDPGVSRRHARIFAEGDAYHVEDLGSANGTWVNGQAVESRPLADGDAITLGPVVFEFAATSLEQGDPDVADQGTRLVSSDSLQPKGRAAAPARREASPKTKALASAAAGAFALLLVGALYRAVLADGGNAAQPGPEPAVLARRPIEASFGLGDGVTFERGDLKAFEFEFVSPTRALAILTYQALDISQGEVSISVNGHEVAQVPADTVLSADQVLEVLISPSILKNGEKNQLLFDNLENPPGNETWRVWNLRIETIPLPELPTDQLIAEAKASFERGVRNSERRDVGAQNRYEAWKDFRNAWLLLEGHPEPKPELYELARAKVKESQQELDRTCAKLMLEVEKYVNTQDWEAARGTLDHVAQYFPNPNDQACPNRAERKRYEYGL